MKIFIKVRNRFYAIHNWATCPHQDVLFLKNIHRHEFFVYVKVEVGHSNRDIEFLQLQCDIDATINTLYQKSNLLKNTYLLESKSCEMIANDIYKMLKDKYNIVSIEIGEDGENFGIIERD